MNNKLLPPFLQNDGHTEEDSSFSFITLRIKVSDNSNISITLNELSINFYTQLFKETHLHEHYHLYLFYWRKSNSKHKTKISNIWEYYNNDIINSMPNKIDFHYKQDDSQIFSGLIQIHLDQLKLLESLKSHRGILILSASIEQTYDSLVNLSYLMNTGSKAFYSVRVNMHNDIVLCQMHEYDIFNYSTMTFVLSNKTLNQFFRAAFA